MVTDHEYAVLGGVDRAKIGKTIAAVAGALSLLLGLLVSSLISMVRESWGLNLPNAPALKALLSAGAVYGALYWLFSRYAWRLSVAQRFFRVPDLRGKWECQGTPLGEEQAAKPWVATVTITQTWDKVRVHSQTATSTSNSLAAAIHYDPIEGYLLLYTYRNEPRPGQPELRSHRGFATITFDEKLRGADGSYFNGLGRATSGIMKLRRI